MIKEINEYLQIDAPDDFWKLISEIIKTFSNTANISSLCIDSCCFLSKGTLKTLIEDEKETDIIHYLRNAFSLIVSNDLTNEEEDVLFNFEKKYDICLDIIYKDEDNLITLHSFHKE